jgi:hypothetical protein
MVGAALFGEKAPYCPDSAQNIYRPRQSVKKIGGQKNRGSLPAKRLPRNLDAGILIFQSPSAEKETKKV